MTPRSGPTHRSPEAAREPEPLTVLGLPEGATPEDIDATHEALNAFLATAPNRLHGWAGRRRTTAEAAYRLVSASTAELEPGSGATADEAGSLAAVGLHDEALVYGNERDLQSGPAGPGAGRLVKRLGIGAGIVVAALAIGLVGYNLGRPAGIPGVNGTPAPEPSASGAVDQAQLTALMQKITANPKDVTSLQGLGNLYFNAGDYTNAATFMTKVLALDPKNLKALIALGATKYNTGDEAGAETQWQAALAVDPNNVEAHYDLGYLYQAKVPPNLAGARAEWEKVVALDPSSTFAKGVASDLAFLEAQAVDGSAAPSASGGASPAASPTP